MESGADFTATEVVVVALVGFGSALLGALVGAFTALRLERRREDRQRRIAQSAVVLEFALLAAALEAAVHDGEIRREQLTRPYWDRYGPELINYFPDYLIKTIHVVLVDSFDSIKRAYQQLKGGVHAAYLPPVKAMLLSWAYSADRINQMIAEYGKTRRIALPANESQSDMFLRIVGAVEEYAFGKVKEAGLPTDTMVASTDDADLSRAPDGWKPPSEVK